MLQREKAIEVSITNIESTAIERVKYFSNFGLLVLRFKSNPKKVYLYSCDKELLAKFITAESKGKFYHKYLKSRRVSLTD